MAELFGAVFAGKAIVGRFVKPLGMKLVKNLPHQKQKKRYPQKAPGIKRGDEEKRREHHRKIPVINTTARTATVFHKPRLEGTEKQYTYHIANRIEKAYYQ